MPPVAVATFAASVSVAFADPDCPDPPVPPGLPGLPVVPGDPFVPTNVTVAPYPEDSEQTATAIAIAAGNRPTFDRFKLRMEFSSPHDDF
jgi:hypothetical protein